MITTVAEFVTKLQSLRNDKRFEYFSEDIKIAHIC